MTDFRHVRTLCVYSGGTVPESNRIHYSPSGPYDSDGTQVDEIAILLYAFFRFCQDRNLRIPTKTIK